MTWRSLTFPPIGNSFLGHLGVADVAASPGFTELRSELLPHERGSVVHVSDDITGWLELATQQANASSYRFDIRSLHGPDEPKIIDLSEPDDAAALSTLRICEDRGTAKLTVLLAFDGAGTVELGGAGVSHAVHLTSGQLVVAPAYLVLHVSEPSSSLRCLWTTGHGPAFR